MAMFNYESDELAKICQGSHSSDTLYVAECKKTIIDGVKGGYPQLTDYEKEWLMYGREHYEGGTPSNLEYQSVTVNPIASVENAIPYHYKRAILKGDSQRVFSPTKNLFDGELEQGTISSSNGNNGDLSSAIRSKNFVEIGTNTAFTLSRKKGTASLGFRCYDKNKNFLGTIFTAINAGTLKVTYTTNSNTVYIRFIDNTNDLTNKYQIEIGSTATDYEEPNYELKSVTMPVLKTSNEDGTKTNILTVNEDVTLRSNGDVYDELNLLTGRLTQRIDENNEVLAQEVVKTVALSHQIKPYEGVNHYEVSSDTISPIGELSVPVVSTGAQTLNEILTSE